MNKIDKKPAWKLRADDFSKSKVHAPQDWRFQMFFEYLVLALVITWHQNVKMKQNLLRL